MERLIGAYVKGGFLERLFRFDFCNSSLDRLLECNIDVLLHSGYIINDCGLVFFTLLRGDRRQSLGLVTSLSSPTHVMPTNMLVSTGKRGAILTSYRKHKH